MFDQKTQTTLSQKLLNLVLEIEEKAGNIIGFDIHDFRNKPISTSSMESVEFRAEAILDDCDDLKKIIKELKDELENENE